MKAWDVIVLSIFLISDVGAQSVLISGRVLNKSEIPVQSALVLLQKAGLRDTTDSKGKFEIAKLLAGANPSNSRNGSRYSMRLNRSDGPIRPFSLSGQVVPPENEPATWRIYPPKGQGPSAKIEMISFGRGRPPSAQILGQNDGEPGLSKSAASPDVDTLVVSHAAFVPRKLPVDSYIKQEGDILLDSFPRWRDPMVLSMPGCGNPAVFFSSSGAMHLFYTNASAGGVRMSMRTKAVGSQTFGNELPVYTGAKTVSLYQVGGDTLYVAVETASIVAVLGTVDAGEHWWQEVSY